jgi:hypothetical protein
MSTTTQGWISLPQRLKGTDIEMFLELIRQANCKLRVAMPGVVQSFNAESQTMVVQVSVNELILDPVTHIPGWKPIPQLLDVPVILPGGGGPNGIVITIPFAPGDEVMVIFADMCTDSWEQSGGTNNNQPIKRRHDLSDAYAIPGPRSAPNAIPDYSTTAAQIRTVDGTIAISINESGLVLKGQVTINGNLNVTGDMSSTGPITAGTFTTGSSIDGSTYLTHTHSGVQTGGGDTGPVT